MRTITHVSMNLVFVFMLANELFKEAGYDVNQAIVSSMTMDTFNAIASDYTTCMDDIVIINYFIIF